MNLFHGPEARGRAVAVSLEVGRPASDPIGDQGLKIADSRRIIELARDPGVGTKPPSLVVGPLDQATPEAGDALLKTLEEISEAPLRLVLWADYLSGVIPTIRSRSLPVWCPPLPGHTKAELWAFEEDAQRLARGLARGDSLRVLDTLRGVEKTQDLPTLVEATLEVMARDLEISPAEEKQRTLQAWLSLRELMKKPAFTKGRYTVITVADALLPPDLGVD